MNLGGLGFDHGLAFQASVWNKLGVHVTHSVLDRASFSLVAAFGCCKFRLSIESVGTLLQAAIWGGGGCRAFLCVAVG